MKYTELECGQGVRLAARLRRGALLVLAAGILLCASAAYGEDISFTYTGSGDPNFDPGAVATGSGMFTTNDSNNPAGIGDLSSFSFALSVTYGGYTDTYNYGLSDLTAFQADFTGSALTDLTLTTDHLPATYNWNEAFNIDGLGAGQSYTDDGDGDNISIGGVALEQPVATPEPSSWLLLASGMLFGLALGWRRAVDCLR